MKFASVKTLVLHDKPSDFQDWLEAEFPEVRFGWAAGPEDVLAALSSLNPEVVFSIKHSAFPGSAHAPALHHSTVRWFHVGGSGYEHLGKWDSQLVTVTNSAGVLAPFHAERAVAALLALSTGLRQDLVAQQERVWRPRRFETLQGKTLLVVGLGATGQELARRAAAMGMKVVGVRRSQGEGCEGVEEIHPPEALKDLWGRADVVSLNVPSTPETRHLVNSDVFRLLPPQAILLNASRGAVVEESALAEALTERRIAGAWCDVFEIEPLPKNSPLWQLDNLLITPHIADQVSDFPLRFARFFADNLRRYLRNEALINRVSSPG